MYKPWTKVNDELGCNGKGVISKIGIFNNDEFGYEVKYDNGRVEHHLNEDSLDRGRRGSGGRRTKQRK